MGLRKSEDAGVEGAPRVLRIPIPGEGLAGDRDDGGESVLDAMAELGDEELAFVLRALAIGDIDEGSDRAVRLAVGAAERPCIAEEVERSAIAKAHFLFEVPDLLAARGALHGQLVRREHAVAGEHLEVGRALVPGADKDGLVPSAA
jgi:hypothetical protein